MAQHQAARFQLLLQRRQRRAGQDGNYQLSGPKRASSASGQLVQALRFNCQDDHVRGAGCLRVTGGDAHADRLQLAEPILVWAGHKDLFGREFSGSTALKRWFCPSPGTNNCDVIIVQHTYLQKSRCLLVCLGAASLYLLSLLIFVIISASEGSFCYATGSLPGALRVTSAYAPQGIKLKRKPHTKTCQPPCSRSENCIRAIR